MIRAVCRQRARGLEMTATRGTPASRSAARSAWVCPTASRFTPEARPVRMPATLAVLRPCRTRMTVAMAVHPRLVLALDHEVGAADRARELGLLPRELERRELVGNLHTVRQLEPDRPLRPLREPVQ